MSLNRDMFKSAAKDANKQADQFGQDLGVGQYIFDLTSCKMAVSKSKNEMVSMEFTVVEPEALKGRKHWEHSVLTNKTGLSFLFQRMRALGYDTNNIDSPEAMIEHADDINNSSFRVAAEITSRQVGAETRLNFKITAVIPFDDPDATTPAPVQEADPVPDAPAVAPDQEPEPETEKEEELTVGQRVKFSYKGSEIIGTVEVLDEAKNLVHIKATKGVYKVTPDTIVAVL